MDVITIINKIDKLNNNPQDGRIVLQGRPDEVHKMDGYKRKSARRTDHPKGWSHEVHQVDEYKKRVHKMDGSSYEDDQMKSIRWTDTKESPQDGRIILKGWSHEVHQVDEYKERVHKMDGSPYKDDQMKSTRWTDGSSYKDDHMKSIRWTDEKWSP